MPNYRGHGSLKSFSVLLKNVDNTKSIDISSLVIDMSIYEDIFASTLYGVVAIQDAVNLLNGMVSSPTDITPAFPIVGEEYLEVSYEVTGFEPVNRRFFVNAIKPVEINKALTSRSYTIEFCSEEHLLDACTLVQRSFRNKLSEAAETVLKDFLKVNEVLSNGKRAKKYDIQKTKGKQNVVIPTMTPFETLNFLARRSIAENTFQSAAFLFFENKDGFNFCDIEYLIRRGKQKYKKTPNQFQYYYQVPTIPGSSTSNVHDDSKAFKTIISMTQKHKFDTIEKIKNGYFESNALIFDFINRKIKNRNFKFVDNYTNYNTLGAASDSVQETSYPENSIDFIRAVTADRAKPETILGIFNLTKDSPPGKHTKLFFIPKDSTQPDTFLEEVLPNRASYMTRFAQNMFTAEVYGDPTVGAGDVITIDLPEIIGTTPANKGHDRFLSGYFMVASIHHKLSPDSYMCTYDLFKNGFSDPVITKERPEPSNSSYLNNAASIGETKK